MSKAIQCDRCKKCFAVGELGDNDRILTFSGGYFLQTKADCLAGTCSDRKDVQNLCPACTEAFRIFMNLEEQHPAPDPEKGIGKIGRITYAKLCYSNKTP